MEEARIKKYIHRNPLVKSCHTQLEQI